MHVRADRVGAPTPVEDRLFAVQAVSLSPVPEAGRGRLQGPALPIAQQADVDEEQNREGEVCVTKGFRDYVAVRKKRNEMAANGGAVQRALNCHHGYTG
jgi:hypothetical protein